MLKKLGARLCASFLTVAALTSVGIAAGTHVPPMPTVSPLPVTGASHPLLYYKLLQRPLPLDDYGFVEEELFSCHCVSGCC